MPISPALMLGLILRTASPGVSDQSRVDVADEVCEIPGSEALSGHQARRGFRGLRTTYPSCTRPETRLEGMDRFVTIAVAAARVANDPPAGWDARWPQMPLPRGLVVIGRHESAWWRSVHDGRLKGAAGEVCLTQIHPSVFGLLGVTADELVGLDVDSTERCFRAAAELLTRATPYCGVDPRGSGVAWFSEAISLYGSGQGCHIDAAWVTSRVDMYSGLVAKGPARLDFDALIALEAHHWPS